jgi:replicative DNA helicase
MNEEIQKIIIKAILDGKADRVMPFMTKVNCFENEPYRTIFNSCLSQYDDSGKVEYFQIYIECKTEAQRDLLSEINDNNDYRVFSKIEKKCLILIEDKKRNDLMTLCNATLRRLNSQDDIFDVLEDFEAFRTTFDSEIGSLKRFKLEVEVRDALDETKERAMGIFKTGIKTDFVEVDDILGGFEKGSLNLLAARPAMGKTAVALQMLMNAALNQDKKVLMFSVEMTNRELIKRLLTNYTETDNKNLKDGFNQDLQKFEEYEQKAMQFQSENITISDSDMTLSAIKSKTMELSKTNGLDLVIIDYLQIVECDNGKKNSNKNDDVSHISRALKELAKKCNVPIICLSQLSRAVESRGGDKRPILSDLRDSGAIEQDADSVSFLYRPEYYNIEVDESGESTRNLLNWIVAKNRSGATTTRDAKLHIKLSTGKVGNWKNVVENPFDNMKPDKKYTQQEADQSFFDPKFT